MYIFNSRIKLLYKIICFLILLGVILGVLNNYYLRKNVCDNDRTAKFREIEPGILISNTGSSHGLYGFNYLNLEKEYNCFNFALESQYLSYDYRTISEYADYLAPNGIMFITVSFFSFYGMNEEEMEGFEGKNNRYYKLLSPSRIKRYNWKSDLKFHFFPVANDEEVMKTLAEGKETGDAWKKVWYLRASENENIEENAESTYIRHYVNNTNIIETKMVNTEELDALKKIILFCKEKKIEPVLVTTPLMTEYKSRISRDFLNDFYEKINDMVTSMDVKYYDYSSDERFTTQPQLFMNCDHLNYDGALIFTDILKEEIIDDNR